MNQAKQAAARSWRSTLSSGGEEGNKEPSGSEAEDKEKPGEPQMPAELQDGDKGPMGNHQDMLSVQLQAQDARCVRVPAVGHLYSVKYGHVKISTNLPLK